jgi:hypothetical protein
MLASTFSELLVSVSQPSVGWANDILGLVSTSWQGLEEGGGVYRRS